MNQKTTLALREGRGGMVFFIPKSVIDREKNKDMKKSQNPTSPILNLNQKQDC